MRVSIKDIVVIGVMVAMLEGGKLALAVLPNIEVVSLFTILFTLFFGRKIIYALGTFILVEGILYGFGIWWVMYLYAWPLLALVTALLRKQQNRAWVFAVLSGVFGLSFGALCSIPYFFMGGWPMGFSWWIAGIPYDLIHGVSNFILCIILFKPLNKVLTRIKYRLN